jgi:hypothetical protein
MGQDVALATKAVKLAFVFERNEVESLSNSQIVDLLGLSVSGRLFSQFTEYRLEAAQILMSNGNIEHSSQAQQKDSYRDAAMACIYNYCHCDIEGTRLDTNLHLVYETINPNTGEKSKCPT